ncbi:hypothetical protein GC722_01295 [Auraticoccus sp. F435]|uniref:ABC-2 type transport system permease protein n=1 Tax=Auraticoccus cholistanensis TaxID=2656650 RepID=A0A6A9USX3_9ACTN|nr:hypothetical protein [Auraticoccus cholistanensis]MVA74674.1 hypothetical protein [Auraticoccus cholistanensis]
MVGVLTSMKFAMLRHSPSGLRRTGWVAGAVLVLASWAGVALAADDRVRGEVLLLLTACWAVGAVLGPVLMSGPGVLRADYFTLLPLDRSRLALGLLAAVFPGVASGYLLLAGLAVVLHAALLDLRTVVVAVPAALLAWVVVLTLARVVYAAVGSAMRSWLGVEVSGLQFGLILGGMLAGWMVVARAVESVPQLLTRGLPAPALVEVLSWAPTSWPVLAVEQAAAGRWGAALGWLAALAVLAALLLGGAAVLLRPHLGSRSSRRRRRRPLASDWRTAWRWMPAGALGAVLGKELRQWWRDPWRALELRSSVYTGLVTGLLAWVSRDFAPVAPLAGLAVALMICLGGCNLYGQDGSAVWISVVNERAGTVRAEVRGRQLALLLLFAPPALVVSVALVLLSRAGWAWPVLLAGLPALFGVASGVAVLLSAVGVSPGVDPRRRVGPNDAGGDLGLQAQLALWGTVALVLPTVAAVLVGALALPAWGPWLAVGIGLLNGVLGYWLLGRAAVGYLSGRLPVVYTRIRYQRLEQPVAGTLGWLEASSQRTEDRAREARQKEKEARAARRSAQTGERVDVG